MRTEPPPSGSEAEVLLGFLDFHRETVLAKCADLDDVGLGTPLPPSTMTLGGLLTHLAFVEDYWLGHVVAGRDPVEPWRSADWEADADWHLDVPRAERLALLADAVARSREVTTELLASPDGLGTLSQRLRGEHRVSLRWVLVHLVEEYARHNGHADLIRESLDGTVGE